VLFRKILGLDLLPGSSPQGAAHLFAAVLVVDGRVVERWGKVDLDKIMEIISEWGVEALALDNVYELAPSVNELSEILKKFPRSPHVIQVTIIDGEPVSLEALCALTGICSGKLDPLQTAEACALLAYNGVGGEALVFEEETIIRVGRGRVPGQGGMSCERFKRNIELQVKRKVREIAEALRRSSLDYDLFLRKSGEGLTGATFIVYAAREKLGGIVRSEDGHELFVRIEPVSRERVEFQPLGAKISYKPFSDRYLIVGIDPGMSTGYAALDLRGSLLVLETRRLLGRGELMRRLYSIGKPVVVATDVSPPPAYVKKIASTLGALLYTPSRSLSVEEKRRLAYEIAEAYGFKVRTTHERDSLAAAYKAFLSYKPLFEEVERESEKYELPLPLDEAKLLVIKGKPVSTAIQEVLRRHVGLKLPTMKHEKYPAGVGGERTQGELEFLRRVVSSLIQENSLLKRELRIAEERAMRSEETLRRLLSLRDLGRSANPEFLKMQSRVEMLQSEINSLRSALDEYRSKVRKLSDALLSLAAGEKIVALKLSSALERGPLRVSYLAVDKELPEDYLISVLEELKPPGSNLYVFFKSSFDIDKLRGKLPLGVVPLSLEWFTQLEDVGDFIVLPLGEIERMAYLFSESFEREKLRKLLENYREERRKSLGKTPK
jgi:predicted RNase H-like nuclease (RuvC/YqgF family)